MRRFETYPPQKQIKALLSALAMAITLPEDKLNEAGDIYSFAADHGKLHQLRAEDFSIIKHSTIDELMQAIRK